ncbi:MAG: hypothetical protein AAFP18_13535 [Bacteroidota bacterium]
MAQSLFIVVALSLAGLLTVRQAYTERQNQKRVVYEEMQLIASGAALKVIEYAAARSFDERTSPKMVQSQGLPGDASQFTMADAFGQTMSDPDAQEEPRDDDEWDDDDRDDDGDDDNRDDDEWDDDEREGGQQTSTPPPASEGNPCLFDAPTYWDGFCDDLDDLALDADEWKPVTSTLANGDVIDLEVNTTVEYVRRYDGNTALSTSQRSEQKRLTVRVRAPELSGMQDVILVEMSRVLSYREERARRMAGM